jgi:hypothetical protein
MGKIFQDIRLSKDFFGQSPKSIGSKTKTRQIGLQQTKKLLFNKENIQPTEWDKRFANYDF